MDKRTAYVKLDFGGRVVQLSSARTRLHQAATFTDAATPVSSISGDLVFFYVGDISVLHEYTDLWPEFMSRGVLPHGPAGE